MYFEVKDKVVVNNKVTITIELELTKEESDLYKHIDNMIRHIDNDDLMMDLFDLGVTYSNDVLWVRDWSTLHEINEFIEHKIRV